LDPSIYLMNEESRGFGSSAVQMKALPSAVPAGAVAAPITEKDEKENPNTDSDKDSNTWTAGEFWWRMYRDDDEVNYAKPSENLRIRISGVEEEDIIPGFVLSSVNKPIPAVLEFDAQLQILELLDHKIPKQRSLSRRSCSMWSVELL